MVIGGMFYIFELMLMFIEMVGNWGMLKVVYFFDFIFICYLKFY